MNFVPIGGILIEQTHARVALFFTQFVYLSYFFVSSFRSTIRRHIEHLSFVVVVFGIALLAVFLPQLYDRQLDIAEAGDGSQGTPWTVCAVGCDFTTLTSAFSDVTVQAGDYINVDATYASSTETFPLDFNNKQNITVSCQSSGAIVGTSTAAQVDIQMTSSSAFNDCSLSNTRLYFNGVSSATVSGNIFATSTTGTIYFASTAGSGNTISNNTGINNIVVGSNQQNLTIASNTIERYHPVAEAHVLAVTNAQTISIVSNTIHSYDSSVQHVITVSSTNDVLIENNTVQYTVAPSMQLVNGAIAIYDTVSTTVQYNTILLPEQEGHAYQFMYGVEIVQDLVASTLTTTVRHNTVWLYQMYHGGIALRDGSAVGSVDLTAQYNIFYNASSTNSSLGYGLKIYKDNASSTYSLNNDYNGYYTISSRVYDDNIDDTFFPSVGTHARADNPYFKVDDASLTNDTELAPYSLYLDVNGNEDIGSYSAARGTSFTIDDTGTIDYATCDATSTSIIANVAADGDTWNLAAGTYSQITLAMSSRFTGDITISGAGSSTIIQPNTQASTVQFTNLSGATVQNMLLQQASTTASFYTLDGLVFDYNGNTYNETVDIGYPADGYTLFIDTDCTDPQTVLSPSSGNDITSFLGMGTDDYHLALINYAQGGKVLVPGIPIYVTMLVPSSVAANQAAFEGLANCPSPDVWVDAVFAVSGGDYTYDSSAASAAGISITSGYTDPPVVGRSIVGMAGVRFVDTSNSTISNVTSTGNYYGISFSGNSGSNTVTSSAITSSVTYDVFSSSTLNNTFSNVSFLNTSSSISDVGDIDVSFRSRAYVKNGSASPLAGVDVSYYSNGNNVTTTATTAVNGYTWYTSMLLSYIMSSSSVATTNGGYNPYTIIASATSTYGETVLTGTTLDTQNELVTLTMVAPPTAPTNFATTTVSTSSVAFSWTDNSGDEDNFLIGYTSSTFPSQSSSPAADATTATISSLSPNVQYIFRLAAQKSNSNSTYDTLSALYTLAQPPGTVTVTANSTQSLTVSWGANSNPDTTEYYVVNTTNGGTSTWATSTSRTFTGLSAGTTYNVGVVARNGDSINTATTTGSGTTQSASGGGGGYTPPAETPTETPDTTCNPQTQSCTGTPPTAPSFFFSINGGKKSTKSTTTTLTINNTFPDQIMISTSSVFTGASYQSSVASLPFTLSAGDGLKTIYIKFKKTVDGTVYSFTSSTSITLDTAPPSAPIIGVAKSGIENGKIVGQPQFSGTAEPGTQIRVRYEKRTTGAAGARSGVNTSAPSLLLAGAHVVVSDPFQQWFLLAGVVGEYFATADQTGYWEISFPLATTPGNYVISIASIDDAGNVSTVAPEVSFTVPQEVIIVGCTDPSATNFNPNASEDDGSCISAIPGCIDPTAYNYNDTANTDDGSCVAVVLGCRDSTATNYNPQANTSDNSCRYEPQVVPDTQEPTTIPEVPPVVDTTAPDGDSGTGEDVSTDTGTTGSPDTGTGSTGGGASASQGGSTGSAGSSFTSLFTNSSSTLRVALGATLQNTQKNIQSFVSSTKANVVQAISVPVEYVVERIPAPVKKAAKQVQKVADDPQVEQANENIVAPAAVIAGTANVAAGFSLPQLILFLRYLFTQPILLLRRRKQKQWGTIFNVYTKQPIDLATIRVIDTKKDTIVRSQVTDQKGRYFIILPAGSYRIEIQKSGFTQESEMLQKQHSDLVFDRLYQVGSVVYISEKRTELNVNIPLEPLAQDKPTKEIIRVYTKQVTQYVISTIGLYISILSYLVSPTRFVGMLVLLHVVFLYAFHVLSKRMTRKGAIGVVRDVLSKQKLGRVVVRVFDATYNKLVETVVTDHRGRYGALVGPSMYYVTYDKSGYEKKKSPNLDFSSNTSKGAGGIIVRDEELYPSEGSIVSEDAEEEVSGPAESEPTPTNDPTRTLVKDGEISSDAGEELRDIAQFGKDNDS
ncbi:MAG: hypothetical protein COY70_04785 [Candidatus Magasanikbacteria bacterium CG_4_10_14_0_8_um_filter_42_12]|nr:MAG: hypothetical protein COY70_04785 [Candidatus Magasanikbacteria bacterium CG_4_10_14_0_8_um_filter_42_12]